MPLKSNVARERAAPARGAQLHLRDTSASTPSALRREPFCVVTCPETTEFASRYRSPYRRAMRSVVARATLGTLLLAFGCGSAQHAAESTRESAPPHEAATPAGSASPSDSKKTETADTMGDAPAKKDAPADDAKAAASGDEKASPKPREIKFEMTPGGLVVDVEGVRMEPKAQALRIDDKDGKQVGWGVKLTVKTSSTDGHVHRFTRPEHGPLMVAAEIDRKGKKERIGDEREGDGEETVTEGAPITLVRDFKKPIGAGQSVTLFVGLWGMGRDMEEKRLIRKLFLVKMVVGNKKPQPVISAPE